MAIEALHGNHYLLHSSEEWKGGMLHNKLAHSIVHAQATYIIVSIFERMEVFKFAAIGKYE